MASSKAANVISTRDGGKEKDKSETDNMSKPVGALDETLQLVQKSLQPLIEGYRNDSSFSPNDGLDFLHVKNSLLLSYLIELTVHLRDTHGGGGDGDDEAKSEDDDDSDSNSSADESGDEEEGAKQHQKASSSSSTITRLNEMKVVLDKMRGLDKKLRYQIDKLMTADSTSTSFATGGAQPEDDDNEHADQQGPSNVNVPEDPLQFRPNPKSLEQDSSSDDDDDDDDDGDDSDIDGSHDGDNSDDDEDEDLRAARATLSIARGDG